MFSSYKIISINARGLLIEYSDGALNITRRLNLLPPYNADGTVMDAATLKRHVISFAPVAEFAAEAKAQADFSALPLDTSTAVAPEEISSVLG